MKTTSLHVFVSKRSAAGRLGFGDLRRLQRDVLPDGPTSREDVEALLALDKILERCDEAWPGYLVTVIKAFAASLAGPKGRLDSEVADGLAAALSTGRPATVQAIARAVVIELPQLNDALGTILRPAAKRRAKVMASATGLTSRKRSRVPSLQASVSSSISFQWGEIRASSEAPALQPDPMP